MPASKIGRCTAASTARSSADAFFGANALAKASSGSQIKLLLSGAELRRLGMRRGAIEHVRDFLAFVRRKRAHVDQRLHALGSRQRYHRAGISLSRQYDWPFDPVQAAVQSRHILCKRGQWKWGRQNLRAICA